ncbi:hypothetical protein GDO78_017536 [Eleutherodactylus coqui]|uniref:Uncharacterized protein n=1 Tax=Eleutherodactylus coqui TaxID=57060 RepID=A0A8J6BJK9_ELECQ|nr:hypothetical protein GDO78_017536 [Eleutherodactylus coqui]
MRALLPATAYRGLRWSVPRGSPAGCVRRYTQSTEALEGRDGVSATASESVVAAQRNAPVGEVSQWVELISIVTESVFCTDSLH